ncbi:MAG: M1 family metallopeptidase [Candidatus Sungbacteria bacterium]|nr:M1 family metallopeptidase [Candidatus Sungbacteria bacterium]
MAAHEAILLSTEVNPTNYRISLAPDFTDFTFSGVEDISLSISKPVRAITLHGVGLTVFGSFLAFGDDWDDDIHSVSVDANEQTETTTFAFDREIPAGHAVFHIFFKGILADNLSGLYRSRVDMGDGTTRVMATTQFEATDARKAFFCIDEPARKATFEVSLVSPPDFVAISNMPVAEKTRNSVGCDVYRFEKTPVMSTYLLAFIIGPMEWVETISRDGVLVRVYTMPGKKEQGLFALDVASRILPFFNDYFGIAYPLPKLDLIALQDFAAGAMENWGAITYRETALLFDPVNSSPAMKQRIAIVVAHEIAHQWFGNLVTMDWWNDLWLNEGFASWIEYLAVDHLFPEWDIWTQFVASDFSAALDLDGLKNSHPIEQEVGHPDEISELFDAVSYSKGSVVIRMLQNYLGKEVFAAGLHHYLTRHAYGNAKTSDLRKAL